MPEPRPLDVVFRDRRPPAVPDVPREPRFTARAVASLWGIYAVCVLPVLWSIVASLPALDAGAIRVEPGIVGALARLGHGLAVLGHLLVAGLGILAASLSLWAIETGGNGARRTPFWIAFGFAAAALVMVGRPASVAQAFAQLVAFAAPAAYGLTGAWQARRAAPLHETSGG